MSRAAKSTARLLKSKKPAGKAVLEIFSPEWIARRKAAMATRDAPPELAWDEPFGACGHDYGMRTSTRLVRAYRQLHRENAMDITPQPVIDVLIKAGVKKWVLMGLYGYVGYLADPRATQDVDIMVAPSERKRAVKAIKAAWPTLIVETYSEVVRFKDPNDPDLKGNPKPTIDIMAPWAEFQQDILRHYVVVDKKTKHRIPTLEAALVSKFAAMVSFNRSLEKKEYDAGDFRRIARNNMAKIDRVALRRLAAQVWEDGANEIEKFLDDVVKNRPFVL